MGKKVYFLDSVEQSDGSYDNTYGVNDVNAIVSNLVGAGVAPFPSGDTYDVSELNSLTSALVAEGVSLNGLKVSFADNKIHIAQGIGYFENGATIVVDSAGEELDYNVAETLYVYAEYNQALNTCGLYTSESEPVSSTGIYVLVLATIAANGKVTDKRVIAQSKVATLGKNIVRNVIIELSKDSFGYAHYDTGDIVYEFNELTWLELSKYNTMRISGYATAIKSIEKEIKLETLFNSESKEIIIAKVNTSSTVDDSAIALRFINGKLQLYVPDTGDNTSLALSELSVKFF